MMSITSTRYLSNVDWLQDVVQGTDLILCGVSALEYLELFNGYVNESKIQVYAQNEGQFDNIEYHIVNSFDDIEYLNFDLYFGSYTCYVVVPNIHFPFLFLFSNLIVSKKYYNCGYEP